MWRSSQHQAHHSRWVICLSMFASRSYLCYSFLLKLCVYAIFGAFSNYANINLIIQGELTACQCLLLFITLDETGNWRGCIAWVRISSSSSAAAYICMISLFSVYFPSYANLCIFFIVFEFSRALPMYLVYFSCMSVYASHLVCISCRFQTKYSFSPSGRANFRPLTIVWTEIDISSEQHCFEILQLIISTLFLSAEQNCFDKLKNIFSTLLLSC